MSAEDIAPSVFSKSQQRSAQLQQTLQAPSQDGSSPSVSVSYSAQFDMSIVEYNSRKQQLEEEDRDDQSMGILFPESAPDNAEIYYFIIDCRTIPQQSLGRVSKSYILNHVVGTVGVESWDAIETRDRGSIIQVLEAIGPLSGYSHLVLMGAGDLYYNIKDNHSSSTTPNPTAATGVASAAPTALVSVASSLFSNMKLLTQQASVVMSTGNMFDPTGKTPVKGGNTVSTGNGVLQYQEMVSKEYTLLVSVAQFFIKYQVKHIRYCCIYILDVFICISINLYV